MKLKIQKEFSNIIVDKVISSLDEQLYRLNNGSKTDLIISTVELPSYISNKYVLVSAMLNKQDKEKIKMPSTAEFYAVVTQTTDILQLAEIYIRKKRRI
ncbi:hypothetical protein SDC49_02245 [Lactobacillus sp. R2/2]|nr:hypothetical protein [Lactobacillus sp. R2/2]